MNLLDATLSPLVYYENLISHPRGLQFGTFNVLYITLYYFFLNLYNARCFLIIILPFPDLCLLVPFWYVTHARSASMELQANSIL